MPADWNEPGDPPKEWTCVKSSVRRGAVLESELVLQSMGINTRIERRLFEWRLLTLTPLATHARIQLDLYYKENRHQDRPHAVFPQIGKGYIGVCCYLAIIWVFFLYQGISDIKEIGLMSTVDVRQGAWFLTITPLMLHADVAHIVANSVSGSLFGFAVGRFLGDRFAWLLIVLSAGIANWISSHIQEDIYVIGASTACFAAAGLLCGYSWRRGYVEGASVRLNYLPIVGAIALFVFMGMDGENTDVIGHFCGLAVGLCMGILVSRFDIRRLGKLGQQWSGWITLIFIGLCWSFASSSYIQV